VEQYSQQAALSSKKRTPAEYIREHRRIKAAIAGGYLALLTTGIGAAIYRQINTPDECLNSCLSIDHQTSSIRQPSLKGESLVTLPQGPDYPASGLLAPNELPDPPPQPPALKEVKKVKLVAPKSMPRAELKTVVLPYQVNLPKGSNGIDISFPQCSKPLPAHQQYAIIGLNNGVESNTNHCLHHELAWAVGSSATNDKVQLYLNSSNPGPNKNDQWPKSNYDQNGLLTKNSYGNCAGQDTTACYWQYGWERVIDDTKDRFKPAIQDTGLSTDISQYQTWIDVETRNDWQQGSSLALQHNQAIIEGMVSGIESQGARVGIYATDYQWHQIVPEVGSKSVLYALKYWIPGASNLISAEENCQSSPPTAGGEVVMTQYTSSFDYDYRCVA